MTSLQTPQENARIESEHERHRKLLFARRQALIIELGALEDYLGVGRSILPRHRRDAERQKGSSAADSTT